MLVVTDRQTDRQTEQGTRSPIELLWTAKNETHVIFAIDRMTQAIRVVGDEASVDYFTRKSQRTKKLPAKLLH